MPIFPRRKARRPAPGPVLSPAGNGPVCPDEGDGPQSGALPPIQEDTIEVSLPLLTIKLTRLLHIDVPHEVSIIVPRAEMEFSVQETRLVYSSITVVHAPRHPLAGEQPPGSQENSETTGGAPGGPTGVTGEPTAGGQSAAQEHGPPRPPVSLDSVTPDRPTARREAPAIVGGCTTGPEVKIRYGYHKASF